MTISLVVELKVAEGVLPVVSLGDGYPINLDTITIQNNLSRVAFLVLPNLGDRNIASLHVGVGYYIVSSVASNLRGVAVNCILSNGVVDQSTIVVLVKVAERMLPVVCSSQSSALNLNAVSKQVNSYAGSRCSNPLLCYWNRNLTFNGVGNCKLSS